MKKLIAIILSITLLFSFMALPASAELGDSDQSININEAKSIFERIADIFHELVAKMFKVFGLDCPLCKNHDGYGEAEGDGDFNYAEIAKMYNDAVNNLKANRKTLTIVHIPDINIVDISGLSNSNIEKIKSFLKSNDILGKNLKTHDIKNNESAKISALIPPKNREACLSGAYVNYVDYYKKSDDTKIEFKLKDSESKYDGTTTTAPEGFSQVIDYVNFGEVDLGIGEITSADISYKNTSVKATLDVNSKVKSLKTSYEISIDAVVENGGNISHLKMVFDCSDEYNITY